MVFRAAPVSRCHRWLICAAAVWLGACSASPQAPRSREITVDGQSYRIVQLDLKHEDLSLHWRDPATGAPFASIDALRSWAQARGERVLFATNAGIYDANAAPLGLHVEDGKTLVPLNLAHGNPASGNFSLLPNGVFAIDRHGHASVRTSAAFKADAKPVRWATQSGPMLVIDGAINPNFLADSGSLKWRSGVCAKTPTQVVFAASEVPVNFHDFAVLFRDQLGCRNALYLDGTISQIYVDGEGYSGAPSFMVKPYAGILAVLGKP